MRISMTSLLFFLSVVLGALTCNGASAKSENLIFAIDVIRHGDRAPISAIPTAPYTGTTELGQLSAEGMQQEFELGTKFREQYVNQHHLLPETYSPETMYVRSSDVDRTLMSAECALLGLYPLGKGPIAFDRPALPSGFQPIPIHTKPKHEDSLLVIDFNSKLAPTIKEFVDTRADWKTETAKIQPKLAHWNSLTGMTMSNLPGVSGLGDILHIYQLHHIQLPKGMTDEDAAEIMKAGEWTFAETFKPHQVGDVSSHELLEHIANYFEDASEQKTKLKFVLFSAHDTTIAGAMSALRAPLDKRPPYSSDLNFALFKDGKDFKVRVKFNDQSVALPGSTAGECSLSDFISMVRGKI